MKGVQCYELFRGIALKNHAFSSFHFNGNSAFPCSSFLLFNIYQISQTSNLLVFIEKKILYVFSLIMAFFHFYISCRNNNLLYNAQFFKHIVQMFLCALCTFIIQTERQQFIKSGNVHNI